jgi:hypothetical protein
LRKTRGLRTDSATRAERIAPMAQNIGQKLINWYPVGGTRSPGAPIARRIDQTLTQDATGTLAMLSLEHSTG